MPIGNLSSSKNNKNCILIDKIQSYIRRNELHHERMQRLKRFQSLEKSFNVKRISIKRPLQYYRVGDKRGSNGVDESSLRMRQQQNQVSTIQSLKNKIKTLQKDQITDKDLETKLGNLRHKSFESSSHNTEKQVRDMIQNYRRARNRAGQFRSQKILQIIQIKKTVAGEKQKPKVKSLQLANRTSRDFMNSVYLKFINGEDQKCLGKKQGSKKNLSLTAKKFYEQKKTHYRSKTQNFWSECDQQVPEYGRRSRVNLFKAKHNIKV